MAQPALVDSNDVDVFMPIPHIVGGEGGAGMDRLTRCFVKAGYAYDKVDLAREQRLLLHPE
jgi:hypothetical protein